MIKAVISPEARHDLSEIVDYIAFKLRNKAAARRLLARIQKAVLSLEHFPESGTLLHFWGPAPPYRYLICGSYMIFYHVSENTVYIDRILYGRRDYLSILFGDALTEDSEH